MVFSTKKQKQLIIDNPRSWKLKAERWKLKAQSENPIRIEDLSEKTMHQAHGIVAFEMEITSIEATKKLSQNRDSKNYQNIISELEKTNDNQSISVADEIKKCPR